MIKRILSSVLPVCEGDVLCVVSVVVVSVHIIKMWETARPADVSSPQQENQPGRRECLQNVAGDDPPTDIGTPHYTASLLSSLLTDLADHQPHTGSRHTELGETTSPASPASPAGEEEPRGWPQRWGRRGDLLCDGQPGHPQTEAALEPQQQQQTRNWLTQTGWLSYYHFAGWQNYFGEGGQIMCWKFLFSRDKWSLYHIKYELILNMTVRNQFITSQWSI